MNRSKTLVVILIAIALLAIAQIFNTGLLLHAPLLWGTLYLIIKYRQPIARWFLQWRLPRFIIFLLSSVPFILFEENINCLPSGCKIIPPTVPILLIFVFILGLFIRLLKVRRTGLAIAVFSLLGFSFELFKGASAAEFQALSPGWFVFFSIWTVLGYAYIVIVPVTILAENSNQSFR